MKRVLPAIGLVLVALVVMVTILQETHVIGSSKPETASVTQITTQALPVTSAVTVDQHFCAVHTPVTTADAQLPYTDASHGLSVTIPYGSSWTDPSGGKLMPYVQLQNGIAFGPLVFGSLDQGQTCSAVRAYTLTFGPMRSAVETQQAVRASYGTTAQSSATTVHVTTVGSLPAVEWEMGKWVCPAPVIELTGTTSNYILSMSCAALSGNDNDNLQTLVKIAETISAQ